MCAQVTFSEVVGMSELNDGKPRKVKNCKVSSLCNGRGSIIPGFCAPVKSFTINLL